MAGMWEDAQALAYCEHSINVGESLHMGYY